LPQHDFQPAFAERQSLRQRFRRSKGARGHLLYLARSKRRLGPADRPQRGSFQLLGRLITADISKLPEREEAFSEKTSIFFKKTRIYRIPDAKRNILIYLAVSSKIIEGSPANAVSAVPVMPSPK
jgi:hypothetical protein